MSEIEISPAERASRECLEKVYEAIEQHKNFRVEAGAGAGKTYTLIKALKFLLRNHGDQFQKEGKRIACVTYTNVAKDEIRARTDHHPVILADTIHAFTWEVMQSFQKPLRQRVGELIGNWPERIEEAGGITNQVVKYNLGFPKITDTEIYLHHDDVITIFTSFLYDQKFKKIFSSKFPVLLIDEYQDTDRELASAIVTNFIEAESGTLVGFFGDHWQKIYGTDACGLIEASPENLEVIGKEANFRSDKNIVEVLNRMRPELPQYECDPTSNGDVLVYHSNNWTGDRRTGGHWAGDLPATEVHNYLEWTKAKLQELGWDISPEKTKVLMLTHAVLASEQGYQSVVSAFSHNDDFLKKNNDYIAFLADVVEVGVVAFENKKYGEMIDAFKANTPKIRNHADKEVWDVAMRELQNVRQHGTVGDVIELLKETQKPRLPKKIIEKEQRYSEIEAIPVEDREEEDQHFFAKMQRIKAIPYPEIINLVKYLDDKTLYSTKHGVKGAQFENVIVVLGRGWNIYNWKQLLEWINAGGPPVGKEDTFERSRNLFYVACSRAQKKLCLLFTQELSPNALNAVQGLFGDVVSPAM